MDMIQSLVQFGDRILQSLSFGNDMTDAVRSDTESVDRITDLMIELNTDDIRIVRILIPLRQDMPVAVAHQKHTGIGNTCAGVRI